MPNEDKLLEAFNLNGRLFDGFKDKIRSLIDDLLIANKIKSHQITCRVKEKESLHKKIVSKRDKYTNLNEITDLVGVRIITYFDDEVDRIAKVIESEFEIDKENSIDKRLIETDKFGYRSLHYVVSLSKERLKLTENKIYLQLKAEIQIRSILQHAWAEIEHDIGYKGEIEIPQFAKRGFYRVAALLETADIEFVKLKDSLKVYENDVAKNIKQKPGDVLIDKASLISYVQESQLVKDIEKEMMKPNRSKIGNLVLDYDIYLLRLNYFNINTIKELNSKLLEFRELIPIFFKEFNKVKGDIGTMPIGISIFYLCYILACKDVDIDKTKDFCDHVFNNLDNNVIANRLIRTYKKII
ncbi:MAG TPA: hypothetical protein VIT44_15615 [Cyclobacteriaceae bacterium]